VIERGGWAKLSRPFAISDQIKEWVAACFSRDYDREERGA
jgi:hypothetical protein